MSIPVFKAESDAGIADIVRTQACVTYASVAETSEKFEVSGKKLREGHTKAGENQIDLHYLKSVLVSVGWNKNDDVFDRQEVWLARSTPEDKQFNYEHSSADIIGHMTSNWVIDDAGKLVSDDSLIDDLPAQYHVVTSAVLYKYWSDKKLQERMDSVLAEIPDGKWFVSMEALFNNFDYAVVQGGKPKVIARNEETAFLTKHLRAYGGDGEFEDMKLGRLLRNIVFSGQGLVKKPANPNSIIFAAKALGYSSLTSKKSEENMTELETAQKELADAKAHIVKLEVSLRDNDVKQVKAQLDGTVAELAKATEKLAAALAENDALLSNSEKLNAKLVEVEKTLATTAEALDTIEAAKRRQDRIAAATEKLKLKREDAISFVDKAVVLGDEVFAAQVDSMVAAMQAYVTNNLQSGNTDVPAAQPKIAPKGTPAPLPPKATDKPAPMAASGSEIDPADSNANPVVLNLVVTTPEPALAVASDDGKETVRQAIAKYFGCEEGDN